MLTVTRLLLQTKQLMKAMWVTGCSATWAGMKAWYRFLLFTCNNYEPLKNWLYTTKMCLPYLIEMVLNSNLILVFGKTQILFNFFRKGIHLLFVSGLMQMSSYPYINIFSLVYSNIFYYGYYLFFFFFSLPLCLKQQALYKKWRLVLVYNFRHLKSDSTSGHLVFEALNWCRF